MLSKKGRADRIGGLITLLLGLVAISEAVRLYPFRTSFFVGDHTMPGLIGGALILLGILLLFSGKGEQFTVVLPEREMLKKILFTLGSLFLYWFLINTFGYLISTFIASICLFKVLGSYNFRKSVVFAVVQTALLYLVFIYWLSTPFPPGMLGI